MKRSFGVLSRAVLIGISAAVLVAPAAFAATPAAGAPGVEQPEKQTIEERTAAFAKRVDQIEKDVADAASAVEKAKTQADAKKAKQAAAQAENVCPEWTVYGVRADEVEFWQGDTERNHTRLRYTHTDGTWSRTLLWP